MRRWPPARPGPSRSDQFPFGECSLVDAGVVTFGLSATLLAAKQLPSLFKMTPAEVNDKLRLAQRVLEAPDHTAERCPCFMRQSRACEQCPGNDRRSAWWRAEYQRDVRSAA